MKRYIIILLVALLPRFAMAQKYSREHMEVMKEMLSLKEALIASDSTTLDGLLAANVTYGHTSGLIQTKAQLIRSVVSKEQDYKTIDPSEMRIRIYDSTAVVTMKSAVSMMYQGNPLDMNMYVTLVWVKKNKWQLVARQSVKQ